MMEDVGSSGTSFAEQLKQALGPFLERQGYSLVGLSYGAQAQCVKIEIDHPQGISLEDCCKVSRWVTDMLAAQESAAGRRKRYAVEVASPGLDRRLVQPADFQRFVGRQVKVDVQQQDQRASYIGTLLASGATGIEMDHEGQTVVLPYACIEKAKLVPAL